jgi:hypothetical protein
MESTENKEYLSFENKRNKRFHKLYSAILHEAFGNCSVIGHHVCFTDDNGDLNEIPSADTLIFDHNVMVRVFGVTAMAVMSQLAITTVDNDARDNLLAELFETRIK